MSQIFVVIPAYNAEHFLGECLESLIGQTLPDWQAVVMDDGSKDGTFAVAQHYAHQDRRIAAATFPNGGVAASRNRGLARIPAGIDYVLLLDNDDFLTPDAFAMLVGHLEAKPEAVAAYGLPRFVDSKGQPLTHRLEQAYGFAREKVDGGKRVLVPDDEPTTFAGFVLWPCIASPGQVLIRASALRSVGEFDPETVPSDDWDMWLRLSSRGDFAFVRQFVLNKRVHPENVSGKGKVMGIAEPVVRRKLTDPLVYPSALRMLARDGQRVSCLLKLVWAKEAIAQGDVSRGARNIYHAGRSYVRFLQTWKGRSPSSAQDG